ncbi:MAG: hypothetical protein OHK0013_12120 [Sandaracinaceae bacterium]
MRRATVVLLALGLAACGQGHYAMRERTTAREAETGTETGTETEAGTETAEAEHAPPERMGAAPEVERQQRAAEARPRVGVQVRTVTPPVTPTIARRVMQLHSAQLEQCYASALVSDPSIAGTVRVTLTVASGGSATAELETMAPSLDRVLPCLDRALERARFPITDGGPSHVVIELGFSP